MKNLDCGLKLRSGFRLCSSNTKNLVLKEKNKRKLEKNVNGKKRKREREVSENSNLKRPRIPSSENSNDITVEKPSNTKLTNDTELSNVTRIRTSKKVLDQISLYLCQEATKIDTRVSYYQKQASELRKELQTLCANLETFHASAVKFDASQKKSFLTFNFEPNKINADSKTVGTNTVESGSMSTMQSDIDKINNGNQIAAQAKIFKNQAMFDLSSTSMHCIYANKLCDASEQSCSAYQRCNQYIYVAEEHEKNSNPNAWTSPLKTVQRTLNTQVTNNSSLCCCEICPCHTLSQSCSIAFPKENIRHIDIAKHDKISSNLNSMNPIAAMAQNIVPRMLNTPHVLVPLHLLKYLPPGTIWKSNKIASINT